MPKFFKRDKYGLQHFVANDTPLLIPYADQIDNINVRASVWEFSKRHGIPLRCTVVHPKYKMLLKVAKK